MSDMPPRLTLPICCARVSLRRFRADDIDAFAHYRALESVYRFQTWPRPYTHAHARALVEDMVGGPLLRPAAWVQVAIAERSSDQLIGDIGTRTSSSSPWTYELGFTLAPAWQRQGLAHEALRAWVDALIEHAQAHAIVAITDARNLASKALLERLGFMQTASEAAEYFGEPCIDERYELACAR